MQTPLLLLSLCGLLAYAHIIVTINQELDASDGVLFFSPCRIPVELDFFYLHV